MFSTIADFDRLENTERNKLALKTNQQLDYEPEFSTSR